MRKQNSALRYGDFLTLRADMVIYAYMRSDFNERILVILNKSEKIQAVNLLIPEQYRSHELVEIVSGEKVDITNDQANVSIPAIGWRVYKVR